jgi:multiple sugar transport system substrate-binding protein
MGAALGVSMHSEGTRAEASVQLDISHALQSWTELRRSLAGDFQRAYPTRSIAWLPGTDDWDQVLLATLRSGLVGQLPAASHQSLNNLRGLVERNLLLPLDPMIAALGGWDALGHLPSLKASVTVNGRIYAVPFATTVPVLYVNSDLVRKAKGDPDRLPDDWPGLIELARRISALGNGTIGIFLEHTATSAWMFQSLVASRGGRLMNESETEIRFNGPEGLWALETIREFGRAGQVAMTTAQARQAFNAGNVGIQVRSASGIAGVEAETKNRFALKISPFPLSPGVGRLPGGGNGIVLFAQPPDRQAAAWDYARFASGPGGQSLLATTTSYAPTNRRAIQQLEQAGFYQSRPNQRVVLDQLPVLTDWYAFPGDNSVRIFRMMIDRMGDVLSGNLVPAQALDMMADDCRKLLR